MINYDEMEQVIQNLKTTVQNIKKFSETEKLLGKSMDEIATLQHQFDEALKRIEQYSNIIKNIETEHSKISSKFDIVLEDYRKLHSAFELIDVALKKNNLQNEQTFNEVRSAISKLEEMRKEIGVNFKKIIEYCQVLKKQNEESNKLIVKTIKKWGIVILATIGFVAIGIFLAVLLK